MNPSSRTTGAPRQRPPFFPAMSCRIELWNGLPEQQQQECRQALRQILVAVACHPRNTIDDHCELLDRRTEGFTHD
jgi:hypothetical protein